MTNFPRSCLALVLVLGLLALAPPATATVLWTSTFEKNKSGDVCSSGATDAEWKPGINEVKGTRKNAEVLGEQVHSGTLACRVTVHPDDTFTFGQNRVDIQHPLVMPTTDIYLSGYYLMPDDAKVRNELGFFETEKSFQNYLDFWIEPKTGGGTTLTLGVEFLGAVKVWSGDFTKGKWHQIALHVVQSTVKNGGTIDFWLDGQQIVTAYKHQTKPNADNFFFQAGLHRQTTSNNTDVVYLDDFIQGTTLADLQLTGPGATDGGAPPDGAGPSGTADAGGTAGAPGAAGASGAAGATGAAGTTGTGGAPGAAGVSGAAGASGMAGAAGSAGAPGAAGTTGGAAGMTQPGTAGTTGGGAADGGGCACALGGERRSAVSLSSGLGALIALAALRRRRRRGGS